MNHCTTLKSRANTRSHTMTPESKQKYQTPSKRHFRTKSAVEAKPWRFKGFARNGGERPRRKSKKKQRKKTAKKPAKGARQQNQKKCRAKQITCVSKGLARTATQARGKQRPKNDKKKQKRKNPKRPKSFLHVSFLKPAAASCPSGKSAGQHKAPEDPCE